MEDKTMKKNQYMTPEIEVIRLNTNAVLLTTSSSLSGTSGSPGEDIYYGGEGSEDEYGD